jgi:hypothetical protein
MDGFLLHFWHLTHPFTLEPYELWSAELTITNPPTLCFELQIQLIIWGMGDTKDQTLDHVVFDINIMNKLLWKMWMTNTTLYNLRDEH